MKLGHEITIPVLGIPAFREVLVNAVGRGHHPLIGNIDVCSVMGFKHQPDIQTTGSFGSGQKPGPSAREDGPPEALSVETSARDVTEKTSSEWTPANRYGLVQFRMDRHKWFQLHVNLQ